MGNPYSNEINQIEQVAKNVQEINASIESLNMQASDISNRLSTLPVRLDEDGNDMNEGLRNALYSQLQSVYSMIEHQEEQKASLAGQAYQLATGYQQQAAAYTSKAKKAGNAKSGFDALSKYRFGAGAAKAGAEVSDQRSKHYEDHAAILNSLADAATAAANGRIEQMDMRNISDQGTFQYSNNKSTAPVQTPNYIQNNEFSEWTGVPGNSIKKAGNHQVKGLLSNMGLEGIQYQDDKPDFSPVAHAKVPIDMASGIAVIALADAMLAKKMHTNVSEIESYRNENRLEWRLNGNKASLIPKVISNEFTDTNSILNAPSQSDKLMAHIVTNNNSKNACRDFLISEGYARNVGFGNLDEQTIKDVTIAIAETKDMFPDLDLQFVGSIQSRNDGIRESLTKMYLDAYKAYYPTASEADLLPVIQEQVEEDILGFIPQGGTIAQSLFVGNVSDAREWLYSTFNGITINEAYGSNYNHFVQVKRDDVNAGWKPQNCDTPKATVDHELGHQIAKLVNAHNDSDIQDLYNRFSVLDNTKKSQVLSGYAATSIHEFIAESWSEYRNNPNCREVAKYVSERMIDLYNSSSPIKKKVRRI